MIIGRSERIRTSDPLLPKQVRYQTALHSDFNKPSIFWRFAILSSSANWEQNGKIGPPWNGLSRNSSGI